MQLAEAIQQACKEDEREEFLDADETGALMAEWEVEQSTVGYANSKLSSYKRRNVQPDPSWLIKGFIPQIGFGQIYGASGSGKTYLALDLALSVANTSVTEWMGHKIKRHGPVVYAVMEGSHTFQNRVQAWKQGHPGTSDYRLLTWDEHSLNLADETSQSVTAFAESILKADLWNGPIFPALIVFDTQRMSFEGPEDETNFKAIAEAAKQLSNGFHCL